MKQKYFTYGFLILSNLLFFNELIAQDQLKKFTKTVESAVNHSKAFQNALLENKKNALQREEVQGKLLPKISMNAMYGYVNSGLDLDLPTQQLPITGINLFEGTTKTNISSPLFATGVTATQVIFSGLQITNGQKALEHKYKAQKLMTEAGYDQLAQEIITSFDQLMLLMQVELLINDSDNRLNKEHLKVIKSIENGVAIPYDRDKIKLAMLELESKRTELHSNRELLYYKLAELTGLPMDELKSTSYTLQKIIISDEALIMNRKELQALETSQKAIEYVLKKEKGAHLPMLFAFGNASYVNAFNSRAKIKDVPQIGDIKFKSNHLQLAPSFAFGVGMKWNIFEGKSHKVAVEKAKLDLQINSNKIEESKEKLALLQRKTKSDYDLATKKVSVNQQQMIIAKNNLILASRQFEEGLQDVTERLEAENEYYKQSLSYFYQILNQRIAATEVLKANGNLYQTIVR